MAVAKLIPCPTCANQVSSTAFKCPSCGTTLRKARRGVFGKIIIFGFWAFNILMAVWIFGGISGNASKMNALDGAEQAGAVIGTGLAAGMLTIVWVFGAVILGIMALLTRPRSA